MYELRNKYRNHKQIYLSHTNVLVTYKCTNHVQCTHIQITYKSTNHIQIYLSHTNVPITGKCTFHIQMYQSHTHVPITYSTRVNLARRLASPNNKFVYKIVQNKECSQHSVSTIVGKLAKRHSNAFNWWVDGCPFKIFTEGIHLVSPDTYARTLAHKTCF